MPRGDARWDGVARDFACRMRPGRGPGSRELRNIASLEWPPASSLVSLSKSNYHLSIFYGISAAGSFRSKSFCAQLRRGHLRRSRRLFPRLGSKRCRRSHQAGGRLPRRGHQPVRHGRCLLERPVRRNPGQSPRRQAPPSPDLDQGHFPHGRWPERSRLLAASSHAIAARPACGAWAPITSTSITCTVSTRKRRSKRRSTLSTRFVGSGKVRYIACSNFSGWHLMKSLAVSRKIRLGALCRPSGLLLADRPRLRMGTHAVGARSESGSAGLEPARLGTADGENPPRSALAGSQPAAQDRRALARSSADEYLYRVIDAIDEIANETGKTVPQIALNWLLQRPTGSTVIVGARNEEQLRQNLGATRWTLSREQIARLDAASAKSRLSLLAPASVRAQSEACVGPARGLARPRLPYHQALVCLNQFAITLGLHSGPSLILQSIGGYWIATWCHGRRPPMLRDNASGFRSQSVNR